MLNIYRKIGEHVDVIHDETGHVLPVVVLDIIRHDDGRDEVKLGFDDPAPWRYRIERPDRRPRPDHVRANPLGIITKSADQ